MICLLKLLIAFQKYYFLPSFGIFNYNGKPQITQITQIKNDKIETHRQRIKDTDLCHYWCSNGGTPDTWTRVSRSGLSGATSN
ncbi:hypothetical protein SBF1_640002 [Candidatus Desulfosporosinus infrequens]|uniref:Uncharacterized protein n=1 Tax=Candidatus Desulfosporosinus infrequens TaxID=2043169 RepID=A0A2U3LMK5_9FIRM|nr:hypothetical protein SBF1_640002 [Candidatus Desulfosporosinus infrequens]